MDNLYCHKALYIVDNGHLTNWITGLFIGNISTSSKQVIASFPKIFHCGGRWITLHALMFSLFLFDLEASRLPPVSPLLSKHWLHKYAKVYL